MSTGRRVGAVLLLAFFVLAASILLVEAVVLFERLKELTEWGAEHVLRLGPAAELVKKPEVVSWLRWVLIGGALIFVLIPKLWGRSIWI